MPGFERLILLATTRLRARLTAVRSDDGFTIIEVVMGATIVVMIAGGTLTALQTSGRSATEQRHRAQATELAQQDQERVRGMTSNQLASLNESRPIGPVEGTTFTVSTTAQYISSGGGGSICTGGDSSVDFASVRSSVQWPANQRAGRPPVVAESIMTPPAGGTLLVHVLNEAGVGIAGARVDTYGRGTYSATTNSNGCAILGGMQVGGYYVLASKPGFVNEDGGEIAVTGATTTASTTVEKTLTIGEAGAIGARFTTQAGTGSNPPVYSNQEAPALSWYHSRFSNSRNQTVTAPAAVITMPTRVLFPFTTGNPLVTTNNYAAWAGSCDDTKPPETPLPNRVSFASVAPGATGNPTNATVKMPALLVTVYHRTGSSPTFTDTRIKPDDIVITDACGQRYRADVDLNAASTSRTLGALEFPGQPYAPAADPMTVCADYDPGPGPRLAFTLPTANDNWVNGTSRNIFLQSAGDCTL